ncbi:SIR2 family protein [Aeromonas salmonicida]|uniref:SIR2 family protein n=1 Tax=Aeromonas salmonicida TaxID=645 RepID=UPI0035C230B0
MQFHNFEILTSSIAFDINDNRSVTFLFGSAISIDSEGNGVPNVSGVIKIIEDYLKSKGIFERYRKHVSSCSGPDLYQKSFEFVFAVCGANVVKEIMHLVMEKAKIRDNEWHIPKTITYLANIIPSLNIKNILTTNFDPLIEEGLKRKGIKYHSLYVTGDSNIDNFTSNNERRLNVIHLHGFWEGDTMHTPSQLQSDRKKLKSSLRTYLSDTNLYVIGYGGWDDIVNETLIDLVHEPSSNTNIKWCFYPSDTELIIRNNKNLFDNFKPFITQGRFSAFNGIECECLFKNISEDIAYTNTDLDEEKTKILSLKEVFSGKERIKEDETLIKIFDNPLLNEAHKEIRIKEQSDAINFIERDGGFTLVTQWGFGKLDFISSFLSDSFEHQLVRVDLTGIKSKREAENRFKIDVGVDFTTLAALSHTSDIKIVMIFDNISELDDSLTNYLNQVVSICNENKSKLSAIFVASYSLNIHTEHITLTHLSSTDIYQYINYDKSKNIIHIDRAILEQIYHRTSGLPYKLDIVKSYLSIATIDDILSNEIGELSESFNKTLDNVPQYYVEIINTISKSETETNKRSFELLKILSVIEYGEEAKNIIRNYKSHRFTLTDFLRLTKIKLIYSIHVDDIIKVVVNKVNPLVKDYIISLLDEDEINKIKAQAINFILGEKWKSGRVKVSLPSMSLLNNIDFHPGNAHTLLAGFFNRKTWEQNEHEHVMKAAVSYCMTLKSKDRYKELVHFSRLIHDKAHQYDVESIDKYQITYYLAEGLRMLDQDNECISLLNEPSQKVSPQGPMYNKNLYFDILSTQALAYSDLDDQQAYFIAHILKRESAKNSYFRLLGESILADKLDIESKIKKLIALEKKARGCNETTLANNISLELASLEPKSQDTYINKVIDSNPGTYSMVRAMLKRLKIVLDKSQNATLSRNDKSKLLEAYNYLFTQRIDGLFNKCHDLIWKVFINENDTASLFNLITTSSLVWRVNGDINRERECLEKVKELSNDKFIFLDKIKSTYIEKRLFQLPQNNIDK